MPDNDQKFSPGALLIAAMLSSGVGGVGTNFFMGDYKVQSMADEIVHLQEADKDLRNSIRDIMAMQNECLTNTKLLEYRLKRQEQTK